MRFIRLKTAALIAVFFGILFHADPGETGTCIKQSVAVYDGSGPYAGPWTLAGSPYVLDGVVVTVPDGQVLTIEAGVTILSRSNGNDGFIEVKGSLVAKGTPESPITFTGMEQPTAPECFAPERRVPGTWGGIYFNNPDEGSIMENVRVTYAGKHGYSIFVKSPTGAPPNQNLTISDCFIAHGAGDGIKLMYRASPIISGTTIEGHAWAGLREGRVGCDPVVKDCAFIGNGIAATDDDKYPVIAYADNVKNYSDLFISGNAVDAFGVAWERIFTGTWQSHGVPYHLLGESVSISVLDGETLTLAPGVEIRFGPKSGLKVFGALVADGDSTRPIVFTRREASSAESKWSSISLLESDPGTVLDYCMIEHGGAAFRENLFLRDVGANVVISNCRIAHSDSAGIYIQDDVGHSSPLIVNNWISANGAQGIKVRTSPGSLPVLRNNLVTGNGEGLRFTSLYGQVDLGTSTDPGHNTFVDNIGREIYTVSREVTHAIGNYWGDTDSVTIDQVHVFDDDERPTAAPVLLNPVSRADQSRPPVIITLPPPCAELSVNITAPTSSPALATTSRLLTLAGVAADDQGIAGITWTNVTTGESGDATFGSSRKQVAWSAPNIALTPGQNRIVVTASDRSQCTARAEIEVTYQEARGCWLDETFDDLDAGSLDGQNGWQTMAGDSSVMVIARVAGVGQVLRMNAHPNEAVLMEKDVPDQSEGIHRLEFLVMADPSDTALASLGLNTTGNPEWDKKFLLSFGTSMRLKFGPAGSDEAIILPRMAPQRWYHVVAVIDLGANLVDLLVDGVANQNDLPVKSGPITHLSFFASGRPGEVMIDDLRGCRLDNKPPVLVNPIPDQTLAVGGVSFTRDLDASPAVFSDPDGDNLTYAASSSDTSVARANVTGSMLTVALVAPGNATITVVAQDGMGNVAQAAFKVSGIATRVDSDKNGAIVADYRLHQNYPNPFNPGTLIQYEIPQAGPVVLKVFNAMGQEIRTLVNAVEPAGRHRINWDGRDNHGQEVPAGVYLYRLQAGSFVENRKMTLLR